MSNQKNNIYDYLKNTVRFKLSKCTNNVVKCAYKVFDRKIFICTQYHYSNISGMLELNISYYMTIGNDFTKYIHNEKIIVISNTNAIPCFNISFETINNEPYLTIRHSKGYNTIYFISQSCFSDLDNQSKFEEPILSYEDISKVQQWL